MQYLGKTVRHPMAVESLMALQLIGDAFIVHDYP
jgi:hypothetical protein